MTNKEVLRSLPSVSFNERRSLPRDSGVYLALSGLQVLYVGATKNLHQRWNMGGHHKHAALARSHCTALAWFLVNVDNLARAEAETIRVFQPPLNIHQVTARQTEHVYLASDIFTAIKTLAIQYYKEQSYES